MLILTSVIHLCDYSYVYIPSSINGNKPLDVEFVNMYSKHVIVQYQDKYRTSHCTHKSENM
jgi:hypothetical protein